MTETNGHWHLDKRVSVGHIATTAVIVATFVVWLMNLDNRLQLAQQTVDEIVRDDESHAVQAQKQFTALEARMEAQTARLEGRMEAQYSEIIRRLEIMDQRLATHSENSK